jgi:hypothetical protein
MFLIQFYNEKLSPKINVCKENCSEEGLNSLAKSYFTGEDIGI